MLTWMKQWLAPAPNARRGRVVPKPARPRFELERLEDRTVPSAIRMLPGFTTSNLPANDDGSTGAVNVGFTMNFFGVQTNQIFLNNNGNVTFGQPSATFTPNFLNTSNGGIPIIAPFYADVDTTGAGSGLMTYGTDTLCGEQAFGVDWFNVGYFASNVNKLNTFQLILVNRPDVGPGDFDIEFNYSQIQWETGDASGGTNGLGGTSAAVGYSNGSGAPGTNFQLNGSLVNGALIDGGPDALISNELLSATPGRYHFLVRNGQVISSEAPTAVVNNDVSADTRVLYPFRYVTDDLTTGLQHGDLTLVNIGGTTTTTANTSATDACLDIVGANNTSSNTNATFAGPINIVFLNLPSNVTLANPTGFTASGHPYITVTQSAVPVGAPAVRVLMDINNSFSPAPNAPSTFFDGQGFQIQTIAGTFDPTML